MGNNCASCSVNLFILASVNFWSGSIVVARGIFFLLLKLCYFYTDDLIAFSNENFRHYVGHIYLRQLAVFKAMESCFLLFMQFLCRK